MPDPTLPVAGPGAVTDAARALLRQHRGRLTLLVGLHLTAVTAGLLPPALLGRIVDRVTGGAAGPGVDVLAALVAAAVIAQAGLRLCTTRTAFTWGETVFATLREGFVDRVLALPPPTVERVGPGELLSRSTGDLEEVHDLVRVGLPETLAAVLTVTLTTGAAFLVDPALGWTTMLGVPLVVVATRRYSPRFRQAHRAALATRAEATTAVVETAQAAPTVDALDLGGHRHRLIAAALDRARSAAMRPVAIATRWFPLVQVGYYLPLVAGLGVGALLVRAGVADVGAVATIALYALALVDPLDDLANWYDEYQGGRVALARIVGIPAPASPRSATARPTGAHLRLRGLSFAYRPGHDVLHGVELAVPAGSRVAVVGTSGAGKSTLAMLVAGVLQPTGGRVEIGGVPLSAVPEHELRTHVALVSQEDHVFRGTLADNVRLAAPDATDAQLATVLAEVGAHELVTRAGGLDGALGEVGWSPTPAQAQQLALARILLRAPATLVLDEATSALSRETVRRLDAVLAGRLAGRTVLQVVHRLDAAARADQVVVLDGGRIVEAGPPGDLLARGGAFARMWATWTGGAGGAGS